jgi:hypothetical protein
LINYFENVEKEMGMFPQIYIESSLKKIRLNWSDIIKQGLKYIFSAKVKSREYDIYQTEYKN